MTPREAVLRRTHLKQIDINGDRALAHKKFSGTINLADGTTISGSRQTIYRLHKQRGVWKIVGFLGQLPLDES
jgi:ketosteroid isomerase-like protein